MWSKESRHKRGYGSEWDKLRAYVLERDLRLCQCKYCKAEGRTSLATEVDHILPKAKGGKDSMDNLQAINSNCHKRKTKEDEGQQLIERPIIGIDGFPIAASQRTEARVRKIAGRDRGRM